MTLGFGNQGLPMYGSNPFRTPYGNILPPGGKVAAYVHHGGIAAVDDDGYRDKLVATLAGGLDRCRSGYPDIVMVLPGHTESVTDGTMLANMKAGNQIIGVGVGQLRPTFNFTTTASQWALANHSCLVTGLQLNVDGADGVVNAIDINGADCVLAGNTIRLASGAALKAAIGVSVSAARVKLMANYFYGTATHNVTDGVLVDTAVDGVQINDNVLLASATAANGLIRVSAAALNLWISRNQVLNSHTSSTACIAVGNVAATGIISHNMVATINNGTATAQGVVLGAAALVRAFENYSSDQPILSGIIAPGPCT